MSLINKVKNLRESISENYQNNKSSFHDPSKPKYKYSIVYTLIKDGETKELKMAIPAEDDIDAEIRFHKRFRFKSQGLARIKSKTKGALIIKK